MIETLNKLGIEGMYLNITKAIFYNPQLTSSFSLKVTQLHPTLWTPRTVAPLSTEFSCQKYWNGQPILSPGDLPKPEIKLRSPTLQADSLPSEPPGQPANIIINSKNVKAFPQRSGTRQDVHSCHFYTAQYWKSMHWRRKWQPTPVFLPGESQGRGSLVGCRLWGHTESDTTEATQQRQQQSN